MNARRANVTVRLTTRNWSNGSGRRSRSWMVPRSISRSRRRTTSGLPRRWPRHYSLIERARAEPLQVDRYKTEAGLLQFAVDAFTHRRFQQARNLARVDLEAREVPVIAHARDLEAERMQQFFAARDLAQAVARYCRSVREAGRKAR